MYLQKINHSTVTVYTVHMITKECFNSLEVLLENFEYLKIGGQDMYLV